MLSNVLMKIYGKGVESFGADGWKPRPSSAGPERCMRQMVYQGLRTPITNPAGDRLAVIFDDGKWHEEISIDHVNRSAFWWHSSQIEIVTDYFSCAVGHKPYVCPVRPKCKKQNEEDHDCEHYGGGLGDTDGIITDPMGVDRLIEHKAFNHFKFNRIWEGTLPLDNLYQMVEYLRGLYEINPEINEGVLFIKNKNTGQFIDYLVRYDYRADTLTVVNGDRSSGDTLGNEESPLAVIEGAHAQTVAKFRQTVNHIKEETLPERPYSIGTNFPCGYCLWERLCDESHIETFESLEGETVEEELLIEEHRQLIKMYLEQSAHLTDLNRQATEQKKAVEQLRGVIVDTLKRMEARTIKYSGYALTWGMQSRLTPNRALLIDAGVRPETIDKGSTVSYWDTLKIRKDGNE